VNSSGHISWRIRPKRAEAAGFDKLLIEDHFHLRNDELGQSHPGDIGCGTIPSVCSASPPPWTKQVPTGRQLRSSAQRQRSCTGRRYDPPPNGCRIDVIPPVSRTAVFSPPEPGRPMSRTPPSPDADEQGLTVSTPDRTSRRHEHPQRPDCAETPDDGRCPDDDSQEAERKPPHEDPVWRNAGEEPTETFLD
jgi:hypothetical protein